MRIRHWARARFRLQDAVILDTETTDLHGEVIQISVIDLQGRTLLSTLVRSRATITPDATAVHGIRDRDLRNAPDLAAVCAELLQITRGRQILTYNAPYDRAVLVADLTAAGIDPEHLAQEKHWACLMRARAAIEGHGWTALGGPHQALGDCLAGLEVLRAIAQHKAGSAPQKAA